MMKLSHMNPVVWNLSKYAKWKEGQWCINDNGSSKPLKLVLQGLQFVVREGDTALESVSLTQSSHRILGVYNRGTLAICVKHKVQSRKFRVLFSSQLEGERCVVELRRYFDITVPEGSRPVLDSRLQPVAKILEKIMNQDERLLPTPESIPDEYPLESAIQLCVLDPGFPALVSRVEEIVSQQVASPKNSFFNLPLV